MKKERSTIWAERQHVRGCSVGAAWRMVVTASSAFTLTQRGSGIGVSRTGRSPLPEEQWLMAEVGQGPQGLAQRHRAYHWRRPLGTVSYRYSCSQVDFTVKINFLI